MKIQLARSSMFLVILNMSCWNTAFGIEFRDGLAKSDSSLSAKEQGATTNRPFETVRLSAEPSGWTPSASTAIYIADSADQQTTRTSTISGWRTPSNGPADATIKFMGEESGPTPSEKADPPAEQVALPAEPSATATATTEQADAEQPQAKPIDSQPTPATSLLLTQPAISQAAKINDENVQPAARLFADEPLPADLSSAPSAHATYDGRRLPPPAPVVHDPSYDNYGPVDLYDGGCADGSCDTGCCPPRRVLFWTAGIEATFLNPDLNSEGTSFIATEVDENRADWITSAHDDVDSMYVSPRIWIGVQGCKWGANLRYWHMQAGEGSFDPSFDGISGWGAGSWLDTGFSTTNHLEAYTIDIEATRRFCINDCWMQASAGVRHAEIEHNETTWGTSLVDDGVLMGVARANRLSRGTGLVFGLYGRKPVFPCSVVHWFYNVRASTMWGPTETSAETGVLLAATGGGAVATAGSNNGASTAVDDTLFIGEIQLGLEWNYALQCMPANAFFRAAVEYQRWDGGAGHSAAGSFGSITGGPGGTARVDTLAAAPAPELDLVGITLGTGLTW